MLLCQTSFLPFIPEFPSLLIFISCVCCSFCIYVIYLSSYLSHSINFFSPCFAANLLPHCLVKASGYWPRCLPTWAVMADFIKQGSMSNPEATRKFVLSTSTNIIVFLPNHTVYRSYYGILSLIWKDIFSYIYKYKIMLTAYSFLLFFLYIFYWSSICQHIV